MHSASTIADGSSEVLDNAIKLHVRRSSRSKHHKSKTKHKDKRKRRRHSRNSGPEDVTVVDGSGTRTGENTSDARNGLADGGDSSNCDATTTAVVDKLDAKLKLDIESFGSIDTKDVESATTKTEHVDSVRFISDVNNTTSNDITKHDPKAVGVADESDRDIVDDNRTTTNLRFNDATPSPPLSKCACGDDLSKDAGYLLNPTAKPVEEAQAANAPEKESKSAVRCAESRGYEGLSSRNAPKDGESKTRVEDRKPKRKRKRPRHDTRVEEKIAKKDISEHGVVNETVFKHRRKKHKHTNEHKIKKHHDVRKAPQDGIVQEEMQDARPPAAESLSSSTGLTGRVAESGDGTVISEPQRLAIKIKLCQECNSRHLQDACPLMMPQYAIVDAVTYEDWLGKHRENAEVVKAVKSQDPMSEGYGRLADDGFESDDESLSSEQCKTKPKVPREEKQLVVDADRPLYARDSLPDCLELRITNTDHGLGIYAKNAVPIYAKLGPLIGMPVREMDIPDDFSMRHIWEVIIVIRVRRDCSS